MRIFLSFLGLLTTVLPVCAQHGSLQAAIEAIIAGKQATVGVGVYDFGRRQTLTINGDKHLPMQSVYKFHVALAVLREVDKGRFKLTQQMHVDKSDLVPGLHSPMREAYPNGGVDLPLADLIRYTVAESDGSACDYLFRLLGGPKRVNAFIHQLGIREVAIQNTEAMMQARENWAIQYNNWTTQTAMLDLLKLFYQHKIISATSHNFLWKTMVSTTTGQGRLRKLLPVGTVVAHKTGTSGTRTDGLMGAVNDMGFIALPDGTYIAISVFVANSTEGIATNERIIADIARVVYEHVTRANGLSR